MDKITEITRRGGVATVKTAAGETLKVPNALFLERRLRVGQIMDPEEYRQYMLLRGYPHALEAAMKYLALRERSEKEVVSRLRRSCFDESIVAKVMDALAGHGLVSDERFAGEWVESRMKKYGRGRIAQELRLKGVAEGEARAALSAFSQEDEYRRAVDQAEKLRRRFQDDSKKIAQALVRRGYDWALARRAAQEAIGSAGPGAGSS